MKELMIHATTWMNPKYIILSERSQTQKQHTADIWKRGGVRDIPISLPLKQQ